MKWFTDENMVYTVKDSVWLGIPSKENDYFFGVSNSHAPKEVCNAMAEEIAHKLNSYDQLRTELEQLENKHLNTPIFYGVDLSKDATNQIKADAISKAIDYLENDQVSNYCIVLRDVREAIETLKEYADKVRGGKI